MELECALSDIQKVYIEPTSFCNLQCKMCFRSAWFDEEIGEMNGDLFNKLIHEIKAIDSIKTIFFGGIAEPFAHKDLLSMIKRAKETGKKVELITNGLLLNEDIIRELIDLNLDMLWVSVDGCDMESYRNIRIGGNFEKLLKNLRLIKKFKMDLDAKTKLGLTFVAMKSNIEELPKIMALAHYVGAVELKISNVMPFSREMEKETLYYNSLSMQWFSNSFNATDGRYMNFTNIDMPIMDYWEKPMLTVLGKVLHNGKVVKLGENYVQRKSRFCKFINDASLFVKWDGEISPCMSLLHNNVTYVNNTERKVLHCSFGNIRDSSLLEIWNKEDYVDFRKRVLNFEFSHCLRCCLCERAQGNVSDCYGNKHPTCGACLWSEGFIQCP